MPDVSVVISTYNRPHFLAVALRSALAQRGVDLEVIVVDNGSTDATPALLASFRDARLRVIRNDRSLGSVGGRNTGLAAASGTWVGLLDDDDLWAPDKLVAQLEAAEREACSWAYTGCVHVDAELRVLSGRPPPRPAEALRELPVRWVLPGGMSNVVWRRGALDGDGLIDPRLPFPADWDVSLRLASVGPPAAAIRPLIGYRQHGANLSRDASEHWGELHLFEAKRSARANGRPIDWSRQYRFLGSERLRAGARREALKAFGAAAIRGDVGSIPRAVGAVVPESSQRWLHRNLLSDRDWLREAEPWLEAYRHPEPLPRP
jgi:glycosyltransferase involved in cell wall biosynthesis